MSDQVEFKATLDVTAQSEAIMTEFCVQHLKTRGFFVFPPAKGKRERPGDLIKRLGISFSHLYRRLENPDCPDVELEHSNRRASTPANKKTRIRFIISNPAFDRFLTAHQDTK